MQQLSQALNWRYATKQFDVTKKLTSEQLQQLLETLRLAPSSFGLQPWKFIVVENPQVREEIKQVAWGQPQVTDASHLIVIAAKSTISSKDVDEFIALTAKTQGAPEEALDGYKQMILGSVNNLDAASMLQWNSKQAYIALGFVLLAAAMTEVDACPMEGFDKDAVTKLLKLDPEYQAVVLCPVGFRSADDQTSTRPKVRYSAEAVIERV